MTDSICKIGQSIIHHGVDSQRIYLMKLDQKDLPSILHDLNFMAKKYEYTKIIAKIPAAVKAIFEQDDYHAEAKIPKLYNGKITIHFMAKYLSKERQENYNPNKINDILKIVQEKAIRTKSQEKIPLDIQMATTIDVKEMSKIYSKVFSNYPFPIDDTSYLIETMKSHVQYYLVRVNDKIAALASSEIDADNQNAEMTDFATLPEYRGKGYALALLKYMESEMKKQKIKTTYTIARASSIGINYIFEKQGYTFSGTLINNTFMPEGLESMNVWYKNL